MQEDGLIVITLQGGLRKIQIMQQDFEMRKGPTDIDENLSSSEVDQYAYVKTPAFREMMTGGRHPIESANYFPHHKIKTRTDAPQRPPTHLAVLHKRTPTGLEPPAVKAMVPFDSTSREESSNRPRKLNLLRFRGEASLIRHCAILDLVVDFPTIMGVKASRLWHIKVVCRPTV